MSDESKGILKFFAILASIIAGLILLFIITAKIKALLVPQWPWIAAGMRTWVLALVLVIATVVLQKRFYGLEERIRFRIQRMHKEGAQYIDTAEELQTKFTQLRREVDFYYNLTHHLLKRVDDVIEENKTLRAQEEKSEVIHESFQKLADKVS